MLNKAPVLAYDPLDHVYLVMDGTYFSNDLCLVVYRNFQLKATQLYRITDGEHFEEIVEDLQNLLILGVSIKGITCDGHRSAIKAIRKVYPNVPLQRCLVHISRMCRIWLTSSPKHLSGIELRNIISKIHRIDSEHKKQLWLRELMFWEETHRLYLNERSYNPDTGRYWYTHKMVRRAFTVIKRALPNMFFYLHDQNIPNSTNSLESFFGHLKINLNVHRGLSLKNRKNFIKWYLYYKNQSGC